MELNDSLTTNTVSNEFTCSICLNEEVEGTKQCITGCNHHFCYDCITHWFNQNNLSCPMCRDTISKYRKNDENYHIVAITRPTNNSRDNLRMELIQTKNKIYYLNLMISLSFIYFVYSLYQNSLLIMEKDNYKFLYKNCTDTLIENKLYINMLEGNDELTSVPVYLNHQLYNCFFPLYYIQKCLMGPI